MIVITGAAGFIGSCLAKTWSDRNEEIVIVDDFNRTEKESNLIGLEEVVRVERSALFDWMEQRTDISLVLHIGARTDTTEFDYELLEELNLNYTKSVWEYCTRNEVPMIYASSAATYGSGEHGYQDNHKVVHELIPLNPYGISKNEFDKWALSQNQSPPSWYGLKFFNVYGPNENHKGRMASVVYHAFKQISESGEMKLFRSHNPEYKDGEQLRDFVYVKDVISVIDFLSSQRPESGLYNLGTGQARTFIDLVKAVFSSLEREENISFVDTPIDIRDKYQYFTEADMSKLSSAGYNVPFTSLEEGVKDYVVNYLLTGKRF